MAELSHTITMKRNWFLKLFIWFWDCEGMRLNTCLMFWGTLGMVLLWPLRLLIAAVAPLFDALAQKATAREIRQRHEYYNRPLVESKPKGPSRGARILTKLADSLGAFWFKFQTPITWAFRILVGLVILGLAGWIVYGLTTVAWSWSILWFMLEFLGVIIGAFALVIGLTYIADRRSRNKKPKKHTIRRIYRAVHDHTCANVVVESTTTQTTESPYA
jgi:hypothetical protein